MIFSIVIHYHVWWPTVPVDLTDSRRQFPHAESLGIGHGGKPMSWAVFGRSQPFRLLSKIQCNICIMSIMLICWYCTLYICIYKTYMNNMVCIYIYLPCSSTHNRLEPLVSYSDLFGITNKCYWVGLLPEAMEPTSSNAACFFCVFPWRFCSHVFDRINNFDPFLWILVSQASAVSKFHQAVPLAGQTMSWPAWDSLQEYWLLTVEYDQVLHNSQTSNIFTCIALIPI